jgi:hypothetical protein
MDRIAFFIRRLFRLPVSREEAARIAAAALAPDPASLEVSDSPPNQGGAAYSASKITEPCWWVSVPSDGTQVDGPSPLVAVSKRTGKVLGRLTNDGG